jgi:EmrB/QacA subfamily drug resistance transporter
VAEFEEVPGESSAAPPVVPNRGVILGAVLLSLFLASLDQTIVGTALPHIVAELKGVSLYTWVVTAYLLTSTVTVPIYGKMSDVFGRKPALLVGVSLFLLGSALSGQARTMEELIAFRAVQGLGAGALFPIALAVIGDLFSPRERGRYQGLFGAVFGVSFIIGPFLGGFLTDNVNWRWVFYVNLPIGILALVVIGVVMPNLGRRPARLRDLDYLGIAVFSAGVVPLLIGLTQKGQVDSSGHLYPWTSFQVGGLCLIGLALLVVFVFVEWRAKEPIVPLDLFKGRTYSATMLAVFLLGFGMFTAIIYLPRFYQVVHGVSATQSGYEIWPLLVGLIGGSIVSGQIISRTGRYKLLVVLAQVVLAAGAFMFTHLQFDTNNQLVWLWMLVIGLGIGPGMAGFTTIIQAAVPLTRLGVATSTLTFFRQIGGSVGLAIAGTIFNSSFTGTLAGKLEAHGVPQQVASTFASSPAATQLSAVSNLTAVLTGLLPAQLHPLIPRIAAGIQEAVAGAVADLFWLTLAAAIGAFFCTLALEDLPLRGGPSLREEQLKPAPDEPDVAA